MSTSVSPGAVINDGRWLDAAGCNGPWLGGLKGMQFACRADYQSGGGESDWNRSGYLHLAREWPQSLLIEGLVLKQQLRRLL